MKLNFEKFYQDLLKFQHSQGNFEDLEAPLPFAA
jgi:hypothetical protein